jgi:hypothetical protein
MLTSASTLMRAIETDSAAADQASTDAVKSGSDVTSIATSSNQLVIDVGELGNTPSSDTIQEICSQIGKIEDAIANAANSASRAQSSATAAQTHSQTTDTNFKLLNDYVNNLTTDLSNLPTIDPPISAIGQSAQFILNYGGSVTPTWTFARISFQPHRCLQLPTLEHIC